MASKSFEFGLVMAITAYSLCIQAYAQSTSGCTSALLGLSPCLNFVSGNSSTPSSSCCSQLTSVVGSSPQCLCLLIGNNNAASSLGITINRTQALALPSACNVKTPNPSLCSTVNGTSPSASPSSSSLLPSQPSIPSSSSNTSGTASNTPTTTTTTSSTISDAFLSSVPPMLLLATGLLVISFTSAFGSL